MLNGLRLKMNYSWSLKVGGKEYYPENDNFSDFRHIPEYIGQSDVMLDDGEAKMMVPLREFSEEVQEISVYSKDRLVIRVRPMAKHIFFHVERVIAIGIGSAVGKRAMAWEMFKRIGNKQTIDKRRLAIGTVQEFHYEDL
jgi:hypothetical protein